MPDWLHPITCRFSELRIIGGLLVLFDLGEFTVQRRSDPMITIGWVLHHQALDAWQDRRALARASCHDQVLELAPATHGAPIQDALVTGELLSCNALIFACLLPSQPPSEGCCDNRPSPPGAPDWFEIPPNANDTADWGPHHFNAQRKKCSRRDKVSLPRSAAYPLRTSADDDHYR